MDRFLCTIGEHHDVFSDASGRILRHVERTADMTFLARLDKRIHRINLGTRTSRFHKIDIQHLCTGVLELYVEIHLGVALQDCTYIARVVGEL